MASKRPAVTRSHPGRGKGRVVARSSVLRPARRLGGALQARVCAWCNKIVRPGRKPATHGICKSCERKYFGGDALENPPRPLIVRKFRNAKGHLVSGDVDA